MPLWLSLLATQAWAGAGGQGDAAAKDMGVLRKRLVERVLRENAQARKDEYVAGLVQSLRKDGSWAEVNYDDRARGDWKTAKHLTQVLILAAAYHARVEQGRESEAGVLLEAALQGLGFWIRSDFKSKNWWWNEIGVPQAMGKILLLLDKKVPASQKAASLEFVGRSVLKGTGQNLIWTAGNQIARGVLRNDPDEIAEAFSRVGQEIRAGTGDGIQADLSFHQHGDVLYSGGYGMGFAAECAGFAELARDTRFQLSEDALRGLSSYILDGQQWMVRAGVFDYSASGALVLRGGRNTQSLEQACRSMAAVAGPRQSEFKTFADRMAGKAGPDAGSPNGNRHFWRSDLMSHQRPGYYASVRMFSDRMECLDRHFLSAPVLQSWVRCDGATFLYRSGQEYTGLFAVWDAAKVPGITVENAAPPEDSKQGWLRGKKGFVGGVSDGTYGLAAMDFVRGELRARKAWFFLDREFVCLGAGIVCSTANPVLTVIDQCLLRGQVTGSSAGRAAALGRGKQVLRDARWVLHDSVGYLFPQAPEIHLQSTIRRGNSKDVDPRRTAEALSLDVLSLWLDHGAKVDGASYSYVVIPQTSAVELDAYARDPAVAVLANTPKLQAVASKRLGVSAVAFWTPGRVELAAGLTVAVDQPCLVLLREDQDGVRLAVSDPGNRTRVVNLRLDRRLAGEGAEWNAGEEVTTVRLQLPSGLHAGSSLVRQLRRSMPK